MIGWGLLIFVVLQRFVELSIAKSHTLWAQEQGGYEVGKEHYPLIVMIHIAWLGGIIGEGLLWRTSLPNWWWIPFLLFVGAQIFRVWCIVSLGNYWNTRIWVIPGHSLQKKGPYRYLRHPNYAVVMFEMFIFPLIFEAYLTSILGTLLHGLVLYRIRIPLEERALQRIVRGEP